MILTELHELRNRLLVSRRVFIRHVYKRFFRNFYIHQIQGNDRYHYSLLEINNSSLWQSTMDPVDIYYGPFFKRDTLRIIEKLNWIEIATMLQLEQSKFIAKNTGTNHYQIL